MSAEQLYDRLQKAANCTSLLKKYLTPELLKKMQDEKTELGGTQADVIRAGCVGIRGGTGIRVCDQQAYTVFSDLIDPIILDHHQISDIQHPQQDLGDVNNLPFSILDTGNYILSTRVRTGRSIDGYRFYPTMTSKDREVLEQMIVQALSNLTEDLKGNYYSLSELSEKEMNDLINSHLLFAKIDTMEKSGGYKDWPNNRGIFYNQAKTFIAWVNEEDHLRIISMEEGANLGAVYTRFVSAVRTLEELLPFARHAKLGYLNTCPSNLGTGLRASVLIKIPNLSQQPDFRNFLARHHLEARGVYGEGSESIGGVYDISNKRRLGLTEIEAVMEMAHGIGEMIDLEKQLEQLK